MREITFITIDPRQKLDWAELRAEDLDGVKIIAQDANGRKIAKYPEAVDLAIAHGFPFIVHLTDDTRPLAQNQLHRFNPKRHKVEAVGVQLPGVIYVEDPAYINALDLRQPAKVGERYMGLPEADEIQLHGINLVATGHTVHDDGTITVLFDEVHEPKPSNVAHYPQRVHYVDIPAERWVYVHEGDTPLSISREHNLPASYVLAINGMRSAMRALKAGTKLRIS